MLYFSFHSILILSATSIIPVVSSNIPASIVIEIIVSNGSTSIIIPIANVINDDIAKVMKEVLEKVKKEYKN